MWKDVADSSMSLILIPEGWKKVCTQAFGTRAKQSQEDDLGEAVKPQDSALCIHGQVAGTQAQQAPGAFPRRVLQVVVGVILHDEDVEFTADAVYLALPLLRLCSPCQVQGAVQVQGREPLQRSGNSESIHAIQSYLPEHLDPHVIDYTVLPTA